MPINWLEALHALSCTSGPSQANTHTREEACTHQHHHEGLHKASACMLSGVSMHHVQWGKEFLPLLDEMVQNTLSDTDTAAQ